MRKIKARYLALIATMAFAVFGTLILPRSFAASAAFSIGANKSSVDNGSTVTFTITANVSDPTTVIETEITYDPNKLQYISTAPGSYSQQIYTANSGNKLTIDRGSPPGSPISGSASVYSVTFTAKAGSGTTQIALHARAYSTPPPPATAGYTPFSDVSKSVTLTTYVAPPTPPTPPPTTPNPSPNPNTKPSPSPGPTPNPSTTDGQASVTTKDLQLTLAEFTVVTQSPSRAYIEYGISGFNLSTPITELGTTHDIKLDSKQLLPGTSYQYRAVTIDSSGNKTEGLTQSFKTKGFTLKVRVLGNNNQPLAKKKVTLFSDPIEGTTDANGNVTFDDVAAGKHELVYAASKKEHKQQVAVLSDFTETDGVQVAPVQNTSVIFEDLTIKNSNVALVIAVVITLLLGVVAYVAFVRRGKPGKPYGGASGGSGSSQSSSDATQDDIKTVDDPSNPIHKVSGVANPAPGATLRPSSGEGL